MKILKYALIVLILVTGAAFGGCTNLEIDNGTVVGAVFFSDGATRVAGAWVQVYEVDSDFTTPLYHLPVDEEARYFVELPEGEYYIWAAATKDGEYEFTGDTVGVLSHQTTVFHVSISEPAPEIEGDE